MEEKIQLLTKKWNITNSQQIQLVKKALFEKNDSLITDPQEGILSSKKWRQFKAQLETIRVETFPIYLRYDFVQKPAVQKGLPVKCVIMGPCGNGKTSLINHLCGTDLPCHQSKSSLTKDVTQLQSIIQYESPFILYDTPGTTAHGQKLQHAVHLRQLLQFKPINCILVLVKCENRADDLINKFYSQVKMLQGYQENILFLVTHFDQADNPKQMIKDVEDMMKQLIPKFKNQIIYFSNPKVNKKDLSDTIYSIAKTFPKKQIKIEQKHFFKFFNLKKEQTQEMYFKQSQKKATLQMQQITDLYVEFAVNLPNDNQRDSIFQDLQITLKSQLIDLIDQFVDKYKTTMSTLEYYVSFYTLQLKKNENLTRYQDKIRSLQKFNFLENSATGSKLDIRDLVKRCPNPNCQLIWFRIQACPNTACGSRPSCIFDYIKKPVFRFKIKRDRKKKNITIEKANNIENKNKSTLNVKTISNSQTIQSRMKRNHVGCGQAINFETLPRLPDIDKILIQWYGVHTIDQVIQKFQADQQLEKTRKQIEQKANKSFKFFKY